LSHLYGGSAGVGMKLRTGAVLGLALTLGLAGACGAQTASSTPAAKPAATTKTASAKTAAKPKADSAVSAVPNKAIGNPNAPIKMEVFSDYECPSCGNFYETTLKTLISTYVAEGKVYLVHHDFPLQMHRYSGEAARYANAAAKMGKFQDVDAALFDNQAAWTESGDVAKYVKGALSPADFTRVETILGGCTAPPPQSNANSSMPEPQATCSVDKYIVEDIGKGYQVPVRGTPTFVISYKGKPYSPMGSPVTWQVLKQFFDSLLSQ
jgi:protein-disulfide isomerase